MLDLRGASGPGSREGCREVGAVDRCCGCCCSRSLVLGHQRNGVRRCRLYGNRNGLADVRPGCRSRRCCCRSRRRLALKPLAAQQQVDGCLRRLPADERRERRRREPGAGMAVAFEQLVSDLNASSGLNPGCTRASRLARHSCRHWIVRTDGPGTCSTTSRSERRMLRPNDPGLTLAV